MTSQEKTEECPFADIFNEDETERKFLLSKPVCFIIFGKPVSYSTYSLAFDFFLKKLLSQKLPYLYGNKQKLVFEYMTDFIV